jgi:hypothetical protein
MCYRAAEMADLRAAEACCELCSRQARATEQARVGISKRREAVLLRAAGGLIHHRSWDVGGISKKMPAAEVWRLPLRSRANRGGFVLDCGADCRRFSPCRGAMACEFPGDFGPGKSGEGANSRGVCDKTPDGERFQATFARLGGPSYGYGSPTERRGRAG